MSLNFTNTSDEVNTTSSPFSGVHTAFTVLMWHRPTTRTALRRLFSTADVPSITTLLEANWASGDPNDLFFRLNRAGGLVTATSSNSFYDTDNIWYFSGFTYDESDGLRLFNGKLDVLVLEAASYAARGTGSGATVDPNDNSKIGQVSTATTVAYQGDIAFYGVYGRRMILAEIQSYQFRPRVDSDCKQFIHLGFNGTGTQPDWSGNGNSGAVTGATVADHVPLGPPFGFDLGWQGAFTVAAGGDGKDFPWPILDVPSPHVPHAVGY